MDISFRHAGKSPFQKDLLKHKVALITGGGTGIGFEIAHQLGAHGAKVALMGRRSDVLDEALAVLRAEGITAHKFVGDVRDADSCKSAVQDTLRVHDGRLDILVNSAAGNFLSKAKDLTPKGFKTVMEIDAGGVFNMCHFSFSALKFSKGCIINISANLQYGATWFQAHASAAKSAIDSLTRSLALEWGSEGIRVNGIAPGPISDTAGMAKLAPSVAGDKQRDVTDFIPLGRMGEKWEIAMASLFLASEAGSFVTGAILVADGGHWLHREPMVPHDVISKISKKLESSTKNVGRARSKM